MALIWMAQPAHGQTLELEHLWTLPEEFQSAESVVYDARREVLYVSSVNGYQKNGLGYLSKVSLDGEMLARQWVTGLNGPTGMAIRDDRLYVADLDEVVSVDLNTGRVHQLFPAPDENPGLNDIAVGPDGRIWVSGSFSQSIYQLSKDKLVHWLYSPDFRDANGLYADHDELVLAGYHLYRVSLADQSKTLWQPSAVLTDLESIESDGQGGYFLTAIGARPLWHLTGSAKPVAVLTGETFFSDIEFSAAKQMLLVPTGGTALSAYRVELAHLENER